jgi:hypothetical protein
MMANDDHISFRWGIPWLDRDYMQIPTAFFRFYHQVGLTRAEFLFVLHLASYKFESREGQSRPSLTTIAGEMGISVRTAQRLRAHLEEGGLLQVFYQRGKPSIYSFHLLARALLEAEKQGEQNVTPDTHVTPTPDTHVTPPLTPVSPEEEEVRTRRQEDKDSGRKRPEPEPLSAGLQYCLQQFSRKRFTNKGQRDTLVAGEKEVGTAIFKQAVDWLANFSGLDANKLMTTARKMKEGNGDGRRTQRGAGPARAAPGGAQEDPAWVRQYEAHVKRVTAKGAMP